MTVQLGNILEAGLTKDHLATNAETWRHIWFVQRFIQHGLKSILDKHCGGEDIISLINRAIDDPISYLKLTPNSDLYAISVNTELMFRGCNRNARMGVVLKSLLDRCITHDQSKLVDPEVHTFVEVTPKLKLTTFNSPEYNQLREEMKPALDNHYRQNRHHPEHYENGVRSMTLIDVLEMLCDWLASSLRQPEGCIEKSILFCQERFSFDDGLAEALRLTVNYHYSLEYHRDPRDFYAQTL